MPVGFLSDHMEVLFDLDEEARQTFDEVGLNMIRASTVGVRPQFVATIRKLIEERLNGSEKECHGQFGRTTMSARWIAVPGLSVPGLSVLGRSGLRTAVRKGTDQRLPSCCWMVVIN